MSIRSDFDERYQSQHCDPREEQEQGPTCDRVNEVEGEALLQEKLFERG